MRRNVADIRIGSGDDIDGLVWFAHTSGATGDANAGAQVGAFDEKKGREEVREEEGGQMSKVRIYDLTKGLTPEAKKILEIARRMGILSRLPHGAGGKLDRKPDKPQKRRTGGQEGDDAK